MSKVIKQMQIDSLKNSFQGVRDMVLLSVSGLGAIPDNQLRLSLRKKGIRMQVVKNNLCRKVLGEMGFKVDGVWDGPTTVAWGGASVSELSKEIEVIAKKNEKFFKVKGAVADGQQVPFAVALKMPTKAEALGRVVMLALSPGSKLVGALLGPAGKVAGQIKSLKDRPEEAPAPAAAEAAPA